MLFRSVVFSLGVFRAAFLAFTVVLEGLFRSMWSLRQPEEQILWSPFVQTASSCGKYDLHAVHLAREFMRDFLGIRLRYGGMEER